MMQTTAAITIAEISTAIEIQITELSIPVLMESLYAVPDVLDAEDTAADFHWA